jgi:hypothetical protein
MKGSESLLFNENAVNLAGLAFICVTFWQLVDCYLCWGRGIFSCQTSMGFIDVLGVCTPYGIIFVMAE